MNRKYVIGLLPVAALIAFCIGCNTQRPVPDFIAAAPPAPKGYDNYEAVMKAVMSNQVKVIQQALPVPPTLEAFNDLEYGKTKEKDLKLDLYVPKGISTPAPLLVFVHGGGWSAGDRKDYKYYNVKFAELGYVTASISYRLSQEAPFPAAVQDSKHAVEWLRANADKYHIDPKHVAMIGGSAGGYLSMMVGFTDGDPLFKPEGIEGDSTLQAVVDCYGPTDLTTPGARVFPSVTSFIGKPYDQAADVYEKASPLQYIKNGLPPTLIFQGTVDQTVPVEQSDTLAAKLKEAGDTFTYDRIVGWPHTMDIAQGVNDHMFAVMKGFLNFYLGTPTPPKAG